MNSDVIARTVKAITAVLAVAGINISPENASAITSGALAIYAVASAIQAFFAEKNA